MTDKIPVQPDESFDLALAMVDSSSASILLLDEVMNVVAVSASFCRSFELDPRDVAGRSIFDLGKGEWNASRLRSLLGATISGAAEIGAYEMELIRPGRDKRQLVLSAQKLNYGVMRDVRLLLTVADVTDARAATKLNDDLLREKHILLQEIQHRVANSLQIIASVLMQSARRVSSEETRVHLHDAHHRVMSVAAVQQQLAATRQGEVKLRPYFTQLGQSLAASMIHDHAQLSLGITADDSSVLANVSVSLGLIMTELVINALKHAFPDHRSGKITVAYQATEQNWTLSVSDDGIGMPADPDAAKAGLGTSIIEALARQLDAKVEVTQRNPGTVVSVSHMQALPVDAAKHPELDRLAV